MNDNMQIIEAFYSIHRRPLRVTSFYLLWSKHTVTSKSNELIFSNLYSQPSFSQLDTPRFFRPNELNFTAASEGNTTSVLSPCIPIGVIPVR
ncbi:hypothetical protein V1477_016577 [Vespula maculifrons]|uniref:Uncharacterized protein n=1 Tax=Vespula maculifrons TaxID=7453 RepID=A0ABD2B8P1_VESMC